LQVDTLHGRQFALKWEIPHEVKIDMDTAQVAYCWIELPEYRASSSVNLEMVTAAPQFGRTLYIKAICKR